LYFIALGREFHDTRFVLPSECDKLSAGSISAYFGCRPRCYFRHDTPVVANNCQHQEKEICVKLSLTSSIGFQCSFIFLP